MKSHFTQTKLVLTAFIWALLVVLGIRAMAQNNVFSRFDFNTVPMTQATIGPDANSINANAITDGQAAYMSGGCGNNFGFDLDIMNPAGLFDVSSIGMRFGFRKDENFATFFERGNFRFFVQGGFLGIQFEVNSSMTGLNTTFGPINTGYLLPNDGQFHEYTFTYQEATGVAEILVDGQLIWTIETFNNAPLVWPSNAAPVVGIITDGNCSGRSVLDFAEFFIPNSSLPVELLTFSARPQDGQVQLDWITTNEVNNYGFRVERADENGFFQEIAFVEPVEMDANGFHHYTFTDQPETSGRQQYQLVQVDADGRTNESEIEEVLFEMAENSKLKVFPNPTQGQVQVQLPIGARQLTVVDASGNTVLNLNLAEGQSQQQLDLSNLPVGMYFVRSHGTKGYQTLRIHKNS